jgi:hypothetical protein
MHAMPGAGAVADADAQRVVLRQRALGAERRPHRNPERLGELAQLGPRARVADPRRDEAERPPAPRDQLDRLCDAVGGRSRRVQADPRLGVGDLALDLGVLHVERHVHDERAGTTGDQRVVAAPVLHLGAVQPERLDGEPDFA